MKRERLVEIVNDKPVVAVLADARQQMQRPAPVHVRVKYGTDNIPGRNQTSSIFGIFMQDKDRRETFAQVREKDPGYYDLIVDQVLESVVEYGVEL